MEAPQVFFTVLHRDSWGRETVEGYGHLRLPTEALSEHKLVALKWVVRGIEAGTDLLLLQVKTWRPVGSSTQQMRDFFLGGAQHLRDVSLAGVPADHTVCVAGWRVLRVLEQAD